MQKPRRASVYAGSAWGLVQVVAEVFVRNVSVTAEQRADKTDHSVEAEKKANGVEHNSRFARASVQSTKNHGPSKHFPQYYLQFTPIESTGFLSALLPVANCSEGETPFACCFGLAEMQFCPGVFDSLSNGGLVGNYGYF